MVAKQAEMTVAECFLTSCVWACSNISYKEHVTNEEFHAKIQQDLCNSYEDHVTNEEVLAKIQQAIGPHENLTIVESQTVVVWTCLPFIRSGQNHLARHSERGKKTRQTEEEVGRQHQGVDRPGVLQVPEGSGEQGKMEQTACEIICGAQWPSWLRDMWGEVVTVVYHQHIGDRYPPVQYCGLMLMSGQLNAPFCCFTKNCGTFRGILLCCTIYQYVILSTSLVRL